MTLFDYLDAYRVPTDVPLDELPTLEEGTVPIAEIEAALSVADTWLSGHEWAGEAEIGGMPMTSGTFDPSGEGAHVFAVDGEVLDLPPY